MLASLQSYHAYPCWLFSRSMNACTAIHLLVISLSSDVCISGLTPWASVRHDLLQKQALTMLSGAPLQKVPYSHPFHMT